MRTATLMKIVPGDPRRPAIRPTAQVLMLRERDPWKEASDRARQVAVCRETIVLAIRNRPDQHSTLTSAIANLIERAHGSVLSPHVTSALRSAAKSGRPTPGRSAIFEWVKLYEEGGINALLPEHKGRVTESASWWGPALEYFNQPSKPSMAAVYNRLREVDGFVVTYDQVRGYLSSVPAQVGRYSPARLGKKLYRLTERAYVRRCTANALPGDVYVADGYRGDIYLAHPVTGDIWRPEFTCAIDLRSRVPVGWRADEHEGTYAVQNMWAETFTRWGHVPPMLYVDNGSGYKNRFMDGELTGFYSRAGVQQIIHSIPGNPHGKGWVERFFRTVKEDFIKIEFPAFYCGDDAAPDALNRIVREVKAGRLQLPSLAEFTIAFNAWIARYVRRAHPEDKSVTRAELWGELQPLPPAASVAELKRQAVTLTVRRASVKHGRREYGHPDLHAYNHAKVILEYDLMDNAVAVVRDLKGRWICDARLISAIDAIDKTRLDEKREQRAADAMKRLEKKMAEQRARAGVVLDADALVDSAMPAITNDPKRLPPADGDEITLFDL
ncbi:MAG: Mu transposase C-terminal domain-containing protein [Betaproteobacteria bacterium]|nr:Mu transposase C-terminal domain-containing protein [Betaproteobacteria bacterium]